jgi:chitodextrinase
MDTAMWGAALHIRRTVMALAFSLVAVASFSAPAAAGTGSLDVVAGPGPGSSPQVALFDGTSGSAIRQFLAFDSTYTGGVRVAAADVNGDGTADIITGAGAGKNPYVNVYDGATGIKLRSFLAYRGTFKGGVFVAAGDVNGDRRADIITGPGAGNVFQVVRVFDAASGKELRSIQAYTNFTGGVRVAAGDVNGDGKADIVTGPGSGMGPLVRVFSGANGGELRSFLSFDSGFTGGVYVASGDVNGDTKADVIVGAGAGGSPYVSIYDGASFKPLRSFLAYSGALTGGVNVAAGDFNDDGKAEIVTGSGPGGAPYVNVYDGSSGSEVRSFLAFGSSFTGGVYVASGDVNPSATAGGDTTPPSAVSGLVASATTTNSITLAWNAASDDTAVAGYSLYKNGVKFATTTQLTYTYFGLTCGNTYTLGVETYDAAGNASPRTSLAVSTKTCSSDTVAPSVPANLQQTGASQSSLSLSWTASTDNVGVTGYRVYKNNVLTATATTTSYTLTGLSCGTTYTMSVEAIDAAGNASNRALATIQALTSSCSGDSTPPSAPTGVTTGATTDTSITLSWTASTDNVGVVGYGRYLNGTLLSSATGTSYTFTGLSCGTSYTLGVDAYDAAGNRSARASVNATTSACADTTPPSVPGNMLQTGATETTISLSWSPSTDNVGVTGYRLYKNSVLAGTATQTSYTFTGLTCGTTYTVGLTAIDAAGNESNVVFAQGPESTAACPDTAAPSVPSDLSTSTVGQTSITLGWTASADNVGVAGYGVYLNGTVLVTTGSTTYTFSGLSCGTSYTLAVDAYDTSGNRSAKASVDATTGACPDTSAPSTPTGLATSAIGQTSITLSWSASSDNVGVAGYGRYRNGTLLSSATGTSYTFAGLTCGTSYTLAVDAYDAAGNRSAKASVNATTSACPDTTAPSTPTGLSTSAIGQTSITLSWAASTDNVGIAGYGRYRNGTLLSNAAGTSYTFSGLSCGTSYTLAVDAYDAAGNRSAKASVTAATSACPDSTPPSVPDNMVQTGATQTTISLSWSASTDNVGVAGYKLYKNNVLTGTTTSLSYTFTGLTCGTTYTIGLTAFDAAGNESNVIFAQGPESTTACAGDTAPPSTPSGLATSAASQTSITLSWAASADNVGVSGYGRYLNGALLSSATGTSYTFTGLSCGTTYALGVDAYDAAGNRSARATVNAPTSACTGGDTTAPTMPTGLTTSAIGQTSITLSWTASTDNVGVAGYGRYRDGSLLASTTGTSYTFTGLSCGTTYALGVDAYDAAGNRSARATLNAMTSACPPPPSGSASVFLSPSGSDSNPCTQAAPCKSFNRGYAVAQLGQIVEAAGGTYGSQSFTGSKSGSGVVTFRPATGATVKTADMSFNGQNHMEFQDMTIDNWYAKYVSDITFRNINQRFFFIRVSNNVRLLGGSVGPSQDGTSPTIGNYAGESPSTNITIDGVLFHDIGRQLNPAAHIECLFLQEASGVVIRNSKFTHCDVMDLYVSPVQGGITASNVTIENNWFDEPTDGGYYAFNIHPDGSAAPSNFTFRFNSVNGSIYLYDGFNYSNVVMDSNIGRIALCGQSGITYRYNVWTNQKCGTTDKVSASEGYANPTGFDLHLLSGSASIGAGNPTAYPATDIDGQSRPLSGAPDAGADER